MTSYVVYTVYRALLMEKTNAMLVEPIGVINAPNSQLAEARGKLIIANDPRKPRKVVATVFTDKFLKSRYLNDTTGNVHRRLG